MALKENEAILMTSAVMFFSQPTPQLIQQKLNSNDFR
jgi:hypothetical protein